MMTYQVIRSLMIFGKKLKNYQNHMYISCMVGGAGGAFKELFSNFSLYYEKLKELSSTSLGFKVLI